MLALDLVGLVAPMLYQHLATATGAAAGTLTVTDSTITGNSAYDGGGISTKGTLIITNSIVSDNCSFGAGSITANYRFDEEEVRFILVYGRPFSPMSPWGVDGGGPMNDQQIVRVSFSVISGTAHAVKNPAKPMSTTPVKIFPTTNIQYRPISSER